MYLDYGASFLDVGDKFILINLILYGIGAGSTSLQSLKEYFIFCI